MKKLFSLLTIFASIFYGVSAQAGGIALGGTRIIYPLSSSQIEVSTKNTSNESSFLVQSWVDDINGNKNKQFFVTPPLFVSKPGNENKLRLIYSGTELPKDRESLFFFNSKSIPSINKNKTENKNILVIAATTRLKLFVRPDGLKPTPEKAPEQLKFSHSRESITVSNPTPYYITIGELKVGGVLIKDVLMIPPMDSVTKYIKVSGEEISVRTINDYGAYTSPLKFNFN